MAHASPKVGFVSLGCPKALVDSERILTQLRAEGYAISPNYDDADLVVVNTCGFIDSAVAESLDAIGEALAENGKVIVTGCLGAKGDVVRQTHPQVLAVTGPHALEEVMRAVHAHLPKPHDPYIDLVPAQGIKPTPAHYAYLKISEGCNHRCTFCIIPSMRGDLVSRPAGDVMEEAENLCERVAIIGTGHLSLELGGPRQFGDHGPDPEFDRKAVEWIGSGDVEGCLAEVTLDSLHLPGNATHGFMDFMLMMGVAGQGVRSYHVDSLDLFHTMEAYFTWYPNAAPS